ncbi:AAA family ATPase, putative [Plasmodium vivax]|nr:AAA family ATPase, putative [Plasmodium vivax]
MKGRGERRTNIEQVMSDYLINLSYLYKNSQSQSQGQSLSDHERGEGKVRRASSSRAELIRPEGLLAGKRESGSHERSGNGRSSHERSGNGRGSHGQSSRSSSCSASTNDGESPEGAKGKATHYDQMLNAIFPPREREIYLHLRKALQTQKHLADVEACEYLFCYLFVLAMKKMFYTIVLQRRGEHEERSAGEGGPNEYKGGDSRVCKGEDPNEYKEEEPIECKGEDPNEDKPEEPNEGKPDGGEPEKAGAQPGDDPPGGAPPEKAQTEKAQTEKAQTEKAQTEKAQTEKAQTEKAQTEKAQTEKAQTEKTQTEKTQTEKTQTEKTQTEELLEDGCDNFGRNYIYLLLEALRNNKAYWLIPLSVLSCGYLCYRMKGRVAACINSYYLNVTKYFTSIFPTPGVPGDAAISKDYNHFFHNIQKNNVRTILFNPSNNTFTYLLSKATLPKGGANINIFNSNRVATLPSPSTQEETNNVYTIFYNDYIMKFLLKNKFYENVEIKLDDKMMKMSFAEFIKKNLLDIVTYGLSLATFFYLYERNLSLSSPFSSPDWSLHSRNRCNSLSDVILNDSTKKDIKGILFFLLFSKMFPESSHLSGYNTILFTGETGTGKSLLAKAIAKELDVEFIHLSGSTFIELYIGNGASKLRSHFKRAKRTSKSVLLFIDEIDSIGLSRCMNHEGGGNNANHEYTQTLNQLLIEMDSLHEYNREQLLMGSRGRHRGGGFLSGVRRAFMELLSPGAQPADERSEGGPHPEGRRHPNGYEVMQYYLSNDLTLQEVEELFNLRRHRAGKFILFIGATNRYKMLDPALVRSKRFDKVIHFHLPNLFTRRRLFEFYLAKYAAAAPTMGAVPSTAVRLSPTPPLSSPMRHKFGGRFNALHPGAADKYEHLLKSLSRGGGGDQEGSYGEDRYKEGRYGEDRYKEDRYSEDRYPDGRYSEDRYADCPVDTLALSLLTTLFNCADIDEIVHSVQMKSLTRSGQQRHPQSYQQSYKQHPPHRQSHNLGSALFEVVDSALFNKFTHDSHGEKLSAQGSKTETSGSNGGANGKLSGNNWCTDADYDDYLSKFVLFCNDELEKRINGQESRRNEQRAGGHEGHGGHSHGEALTFEDLLFFKDFEKLKIKIWRDEDMNFLLQNGFCVNGGFAPPGRSYHLCLLWRSIESFYAALHASCRRADP